jgi:hypothetical protein
MKFLLVISLIVLLAACAEKPPQQKDLPDNPQAVQPTTPPLPNKTGTEPQAEAMPTEPPQLVQADLPDLGPAPELANQVWLNSPAPLRLGDLRGKVVLIDMWTFG